MSSLRFQKFVGASCVVTNTRAFEIVRQTLSRSRHATLRCVALRCVALRWVALRCVAVGNEKDPRSSCPIPWVVMFAVGRSWFGYSRPTGSVQRIAAHSCSRRCCTRRSPCRSICFKTCRRPCAWNRDRSLLRGPRASSGLALEVGTCGRRDRRVPGLRTRVRPERCHCDQERRRVRALPIRFQFRPSSASPQGPSFRPALRHGRWRACTSRSARG